MGRGVGNDVLDGRGGVELFEVGFQVGILMVGQNSMRGRARGQWLPRILMSQQGLH